MDILGIKINPVSYTEVVETVKSFLKDNNKHQIVTVNPEFIVTAQRDLQFKQILNESALSVPDGVGILWASKVLGLGIKDRVTGTDLIDYLAATGEKEGWKFFFLGGKAGSAVAAVSFLKTKYPQLQIAGTFEGDGSLAGDSETLNQVNKAGEIDILLVAYGHPKQEKWLKRNLNYTDAKIGIGVGGAFDYLSNRKKRAPAILRHVGLEWLFRLISEPSRWKRQLDLPRFILLVLKERLRPSS